MPIDHQHLDTEQRRAYWREAQRRYRTALPPHVYQEIKQRQVAAHRERMRNDPAYRERRKAYQRKAYQRKRARAAVWAAIAAFDEEQKGDSHE